MGLILSMLSNLRGGRRKEVCRTGTASLSPPSIQESFRSRNLVKRSHSSPLAQIPMEMPTSRSLRSQSRGSETPDRLARSTRSSPLRPRTPTSPGASVKCSTPVEGKGALLGGSQSPVKRRDSLRVRVISTQSKRSPIIPPTSPSAKILNRSSRRQEIELERISEASSKEASPSSFSAEVTAAKEHFHSLLLQKSTNAIDVDSSTTSSRSPSPKRRRVISHSSNEPALNKSQIITGSSSSPSKSKPTSPSKRVSFSNNLTYSNNTKVDSIRRPQITKVQSRGEQGSRAIAPDEESIASSHATVSVPSAVQRAKRQIFSDLEEEIMIAAEKNVDATWLIIYVFSIGLGQKLDEIFTSSVSKNRKEMTELVLTYITGLWKVPDDINSENLSFFAGRVVFGSDPTDTGIYLKDASAQSEDIWKLDLTGVIADCLKFASKVGYTLLLYGSGIDTKNKTIRMDSNNLQKNLYIIIYSKNGRNSPVYEKNTISSSIYFSSEITSFFLPLDDVNLSSVVLTYSSSLPEARVEFTSSDGPERRNNVVAENELQLEASDSETSNNREIPIPNGRERLASNSNNEHAAGTSEVSFRRERRASSPVVLRAPFPQNTSGMTYDDWVATGWFVPGHERPKVKKVKLGEGYRYQLLKELDDELRHLIVAEGQSGRSPSMILPEQRFAYGVVDEIVPTRFGTKSTYNVRISDETMDNVLLRLCISDLQPRLGPEIRVGNIIRAHRMTVQVERDPLLEKQVMVLSTTPHYNYTLFYCTDNERSKITFNSVAKSVSLTESDKERIFKLMTFRDNRARQSDPEPVASNSNEASTTVQDSEPMEIDEDDMLRSNPEMPKNQKETDTCAPKSCAQDSFNRSGSRRVHGSTSPVFHRSPPPTPD